MNKNIKFIAWCLLSLIVTSCTVSHSSSTKGPKITRPRGNSESQIYEKEEKAAAPVKSNGTTAYIDQWSATAMTEMVRTGIPASITLAQGILESGAGNSEMAQNAKNHFGIKCGGEWEGKAYYHDDDKKQECFRKYDNAAESYKDHSAFLQRPRYEKLFKLSPTDYKGWARGLKAAGYATDPHYPHKLIDIIEKYQLHEYDKKALGKSDAKGDLYFEQSKTTTPANKSEQKVEGTTVATNTDNSSKPGYYTVKDGDTLYGIAKKHKVNVENIVNWNNLKSYSVSQGQSLKISN